MSSTNEHDHNEEDCSFQLLLPRKVSINGMSAADDDYCSTTVSSSLFEEDEISTIIDSGTQIEDNVVTRSNKQDGEEEDIKVHDNDDDDEACTIYDDDFLSLLGIQTDSNDDVAAEAEECDEDINKKLVLKKVVPPSYSSSSSSEEDMEFETFLSLLDGMNDTTTDNNSAVSVDGLLDNDISILMLENNNDVEDPTSVVSSIIPPRCLVDDFVGSNNMEDSNNIITPSSSPSLLMEEKDTEVTTTSTTTRSKSIIEHQEQGTLKLRRSGSTTNKRLRSVRSVSMSSSVKRRFRPTTITKDNNSITIPSSVLLEQVVDVEMPPKVEQSKMVPQRRYTTRSQRAQVHPLK
jgi:hypothetical protein